MRDLETIVKSIFEMNLKVPEGFPTDWKALVGIYNGCGPDSMPSEMRDALTWLFHEFEEAFCIHDYDFSKSDGTQETYTQVAQRLTENVFKITNLEGRTPIEYSILRAKANLVLEALEKFGFKCYVESAKKDGNHE